MAVIVMGVEDVQIVSLTTGPGASWSCWALLISYVGGADVGARDSVILPCSLVGVFGLPIRLLLHVPVFFRRSLG